eukprot:4869309-Lingulodinium_polyedra.AAC.1
MLASPDWIVRECELGPQWNAREQRQTRTCLARAPAWRGPAVAHMGPAQGPEQLNARAGLARRKAP